MNRIELRGNLGADAQSAMLKNGDCVLNLRLCTSKKVKRDNDYIEYKEWHNVTAYRDLAQRFMGLRKGDKVSVIGELNYSEKEVNGHTIKYAKITAFQIDQIVTTKPNSEIIDDDIKF